MLKALFQPRKLICMLGVAAAYFLAAQAGLKFAAFGHNVTVVWPPSGIALAVLILSDFACWPGVALGALVTHLASGVPLAGSLVITAGNTLEAVIGAYCLLRLARFRFEFDRVRDVLAFLVFGVLLSPIIGATVGITTLFLTGDLLAQSIPAGWFIWWAGHGLGILVVAPTLLIWFTQRKVHWSRRRWVEAILLTLAVIGVCYLVFYPFEESEVDYPLVYLTFPFLIWVALRFGPRGTATIALLISVIAVLATSGQDGPFAQIDTIQSEIFLASFVVVTTITAMLLAAVLTAKKKSEADLAHQRDFATQVMNALGQGVCVTAEQGRFEFVNPAYTRMLGYELSDLIGKTPKDVTLQEDFPILEQAYRDRKAGQATTYETRLRRTDGEIVHALITGTPRWDNGQVKGAITVITDVTEIRRTEAALKKSEEENHIFLERLKALHEIGFELASIESFDDLCRQAIELGRERLGFDRMGLWLTDEDPNFMVGSFGTNEQGQTRDERGQRVSFDLSWYPLTDTGPYGRRVYYRESGLLFNDRHETVGTGWVAMGYLRDGDRLIGALSTDNFLSRQYAPASQLELLALYANTLAYLCVRKRAEQRLREAEEKFSKAFHSNLSGITISSLEEGQYLEINRAFLNIMGYQREEVIGHSARELNVWESPGDREKFIQHLHELGRIREEEYAFRTKSGEMRNVLISADVIELAGKAHLLGTLQDISERKRAEKALHESEARFRLVFESATLGITVVNSRGQLQLANPAFALLLDYTLDELRLMSFMDYTHADDLNHEMSLFKSLIEGQIDHYEIEKRYFRKERQVVWVRLYVSRFPSPTDEQPFAIAVIEDITQRKAAQRALQELTSDLERRVQERTSELEQANQRLTELDRLKTKFIADVSHELRTPLAVLNTRVYLLQKSKPEKHPEYLNALQLQIERLTHFVNAILDLSRLELGAGKIKFASIDLVSVVGQVVTALAPRAEQAGLEIVYENGVKLPAVRGEFNQLAQVVTNLVANAINYTPNGYVHVRTSYDIDHERVCLEVQDSGIGIHPEDITHLFERFYRGEKTGQSNIPGSGLGLSIVKEIVDLHDGDIQVESELDKGTTFRVLLPPWTG